MSRFPEPEEEPEPGPPEPSGHVGTTSAAAVGGFATAGLVIGWLLRPVSVQVSGVAPIVSWVQVWALVLAAAILGGVAWTTYRAVHRRRERIEPYRAVNRLVLAKACALAGALVAGGYFGYAISWIGIGPAELGQQRMLRSVLAGVAGVACVAGSLLLERACRISRDDDSP